MKILVTGGGGFIGSHLIKRLLVEGLDVCSLTRTSEYPKNLTGISFPIKNYVGDFGDINLMKQVLHSVDVVIHLGWTTVPGDSSDNPQYDINSNVVGTVNLLEACIEKGVKQFIFMSTGGAIYGKSKDLPISELQPTNPISGYGISKLMVEKYLHFFQNLRGMNYTIVRAGNAYGHNQSINKGQGVVGTWVTKGILNETIEIWGDGSTIRDYVHVEDLVKAVTQVMDNKVAFNKVYNVGTGVGTSLFGIAEEIKKFLPIKLIMKEGRQIDVPANILDISAIKNELGWEPKISLSEGINTLFKELTLISSKGV